MPKNQLPPTLRTVPTEAALMLDNASPAVDVNVTSFSSPNNGRRSPTCCSCDCHCTCSSTTLSTVFPYILRIGVNVNASLTAAFIFALLSFKRAKGNVPLGILFSICAFLPNFFLPLASGEKFAEIVMALRNQGAVYRLLALFALFPASAATFSSLQLGAEAMESILTNRFLKTYGLVGLFVYTMTVLSVSFHTLFYQLCYIGLIRKHQAAYQPFAQLLEDLDIYGARINLDHFQGDAKALMQELYSQVATLPLGRTREHTFKHCALRTVSIGCGIIGALPFVSFLGLTEGGLHKMTGWTMQSEPIKLGVLTYAGALSRTTLYINSSRLWPESICQLFQWARDRLSQYVNPFLTLSLVTMGMLVWVALHTISGMGFSEAVSEQLHPTHNMTNATYPYPGFGSVAGNTVFQSSFFTILFHWLIASWGAYAAVAQAGSFVNGNTGNRFPTNVQAKKTSSLTFWQACLAYMLDAYRDIRRQDLEQVAAKTILTVSQLSKKIQSAIEAGNLDLLPFTAKDITEARADLTQREAQNSCCFWRKKSEQPNEATGLLDATKQERLNQMSLDVPERRSSRTSSRRHSINIQGEVAETGVTMVKVGEV